MVVWSPIQFNCCGWHKSREQRFMTISGVQAWARRPLSAFSPSRRRPRGLWDGRVPACPAAPGRALLARGRHLEPDRRNRAAEPRPARWERSCAARGHGGVRGERALWAAAGWPREDAVARRKLGLWGLSRSSEGYGVFYFVCVKACMSLVNSWLTHQDVKRSFWKHRAFSFPTGRAGWCFSFQRLEKKPWDQRWGLCVLRHLQRCWIFLWVGLTASISSVKYLTVVIPELILSAVGTKSKVTLLTSWEIFS